MPCGGPDGRQGNCRGLGVCLCIQGSHCVCCWPRFSRCLSHAWLATAPGSGVHTRVLEVFARCPFRDDGQAACWHILAAFPLKQAGRPLKRKCGAERFGAGGSSCTHRRMYRGYPSSTKTRWRGRFVVGVNDWGLSCRQMWRTACACAPLHMICCDL